MKKIVTLVMAVCALSSCNFIAEKSDLYKNTLKQRDSLQTLFSTKDAEAKDLLSIINDVEENIAKIKEAEGVITTEAGENVSDDVRARINNEMTYIQELIQQNNEKIAELEKKLGNTQGQLGGLRATINRLKASNEEQAAQIAALQADLEQKNIQIQTLDSTVVALKDTASLLLSQKTDADAVVSAQDKELHAAYYYFGTGKQLKADNILIKSNEYNKSKFTKIDIREVSTINFDSKSAILLSRHPLGSYRINISADKKASLVITNVDEFWSMSKYLIVRVK